MTKIINKGKMSQYKFKINGNEYNVEINSINGDSAVVTVNGIQYSVESGVAACTAAASTIAQAPAAPAAAPVPVAAPAPATPKAETAAPVSAPAPAPAAASGKGKPVPAPLPGVIIEISVKPGDTVKQGQQVAVLEAMKMENVIEATHDGTVTAINVSKGDSVLEGAPIVTIA